MTELRALENDVGLNQLIRLRWGARVAAVIGLGLFALAHVPSDKLLLALLLSYAASLSLIQLGFAVLLRLYAGMDADCRRLAMRAARWQGLYAVNQRLLARPLNDDNLRSTLASLCAVIDAQQGSLLLFDEAEQIQQFIQIGLPLDVEPGARPITPSPSDKPLTDTNSDPWVKFLLPGIKQVEFFLTVPIVAGEHVWGHLAFANRADGQPFTPQDQSLVQGLVANLGIMLENAQFLREALRQVDLMAVLYQVGLATTSSLDVDAVLVTIYEQCHRVMNVDAFYIALHEPEDEAVTYSLFFDRQERLAPFSLSTNVGFAGWIVRTRQPFHCHDTVAEAERLPTKTYRTGGLPIRSYLGVPLLRRDHVIGVMSVQSYQVGAYGDAEVQLLITLASQAAVAIENALLFQETQQELAEMAVLAEVSRGISSHLTQEELLPYVAQNLARILNGDSCLIMLRDSHTGELESAYERLDTGDDKLTLAQAVIEAMQPIIVKDVNDSPYLARETAQRLSDQSLLGLPLIVQDQAVGVAVIGESREKRRFGQREVERAMVVANQVAVAITNARLYAAEQREREVAQTLLQIAGDLSAALRLDKVLDLILERLRVVLPYESAAIGLLDGDICYLAAADNLPRARRLWGTGLSPDDLPLVSRVLNERAAVVIADTLQLDTWVTTEDGENIRSWLGVPLVLKDRVVGLLMLNHTTPAFYDQDAGRLALAFAQHAAVAIDNARLYEQVQVRLDEQMLLYEMTTTISSSLDAGRVLRLLAERLVAMLTITSARIATLDDESQTATLVAQHCSAGAGEAEQASSLGQVYVLADLPVTVEALTSRRPLLITLEDAPEEWRAEMTRQAARAMLLLPMVARDRVTGFVEILDSRSRRSFGETATTLAQTLINQAAVAVDNARLFAETQRRLIELTLLYDTAVSATSTFDLDAVLGSVVNTLQFSVLNEAAVSVLVLDEDRTTLRLRAHAGQFEEAAHRAALSFDEGIYDLVIRKGQSVWINDTRQDSRGDIYDSNVRSILCTPLLARGQHGIGVLQALSAQQDAFSAHDRRLLRTMSSSLAIAIENLRLVSELQRSEETLTMRNWALKRANDRLRELDRLKSAFVATVSHELRTPLNAIIGFSEVLLDGLAGELPSLAREYSNYIHSSGKHLLALINDILDLSKIQAGRMTLGLGPVDVMEIIIQDVRPTLMPLIDKKDQTFDVKSGDSLPIIIADRLRVKQILFNLLSNANKFTPEGGRIEMHVFLAAPDTLRLDVVDNGLGISAQDQRVIFQEFRQATSAERPGEGTGLGLSITRRLVELHGGRVWVESELGAGSTFIVLLPVSGPLEREDREGREEIEEGEEYEDTD